MNEKTMKKLEETIKHCCDEANRSLNPADALQFTQAALNASNAFIGLKNIKA